MELQQEHVDLNNAYKALTNVRNDILIRKNGDRYKNARIIYKCQSNFFKYAKAESITRDK